MDTNTFILKRQALRDQMDAQRSALMNEEGNGASIPLWGTMLRIGLNLGLVPIAQELAITGLGRLFYNITQRFRSKN